MIEKFVKPVNDFNGKPTPWWRKPTNIAVVAMAAVATTLGGWLYITNGTATPQDLTGDAAPDAVQTVLRAGKPTIVEFGANSCVSCRDMKPILQALAQDLRIAVADVDILKERSYISKYQIRLMPTQVFYDAQGVEIGRNMGKISAEAILAHLGLAPAGQATTPKKAAL